MSPFLIDQDFYFGFLATFNTLSTPGAVVHLEEDRYVLAMIDSAGDLAGLISFRLFRLFSGMRGDIQAATVQVDRVDTFALVPPPAVAKTSAGPSDVKGIQGLDDDREPCV